MYATAAQAYAQELKPAINRLHTAAVELVDIRDQEPRNTPEITRRHHELQRAIAATLSLCATAMDGLAGTATFLH